MRLPFSTFFGIKKLMFDSSYLLSAPTLNRCLVHEERYVHFSSFDALKLESGRVDGM